MNTLREAAQQALDALEERYVGALRDKAMDALRAALAEEALQRLTDVHQEIEAALEQPEQEPVAWCDIEEDGTIHGLRYWSEPGRREHALYTYPPRREWRGLTEEDRSVLFSTHFNFPYELVNAIEAALKERNA
jgi:hypothetical protein